MPVVKVCAALALAALLAAGSALAANGRLDTTFGHGGEVRIDLGGAERAEALLLEPDGGIDLAGSSSAGTSVAFVQRLRADGSLGTRWTFDDAGVDQIPALARQSDGKLLIAWQTLTTRGETIIYHVRLLRLNGDGTADGSFGTGGTVDLFTGGAPGLQGNGSPAGAQAIAMQPDGRILVLLGTQLMRLRADGSLDLQTAFDSTAVPRALGLEPDGRILVGGATERGGFVDAYRPDGSRDDGFAAATGSPVQSLVVLADGRVLAGMRTAVERLAADGVTEARARVAASALTVDGQGRVLAVDAGGLTRLTSVLTKDTSFGAHGIAGLGGVDPVAVAVRPDNRLVVAATDGADAAVLRLPANAPPRPPAVRLVGHPARTIHGAGRVTFAFRSDTPGAGFRCALDQAAPRPCHSPVRYTVARGSHRFRVEATSSGLTGAPASFRFSVASGR
jgi:uncharacterized delta-60 repeat protein